MSQDSLFPLDIDTPNEVQTRALLDRLFAESKLYKTGADYKALLDFVVRLRNFAPFNAMLLQVQKPGIRYAASELDWQARFRRWPKVEARPLLILWPFGPVALVYDVQDTEGDPLPEDVCCFPAKGRIDARRVQGFKGLLARQRIDCEWVDAGDSRAGSIRKVARPENPDGWSKYEVRINRNHEPPAQFATLAHELAHLFLGHLGPDRKLNVPMRSQPEHRQREIEAESVAYIVCHRNDVQPKSQTYLAGFVSASTTPDDLDVYQVMRAAGQVESALQMQLTTKFVEGAAR